MFPIKLSPWRLLPCFVLQLACWPVWVQADDWTTLLLERGIQLTDRVTAKLAEPSLRDSLTEKERSATLQKLAGKLDWGRFVRDSVMAPVAIDIESIRDAEGNRIGHDIHSAFVLYADLDKVRDAEVMEQLFGKPSETAGSEGVITREIAADQLKQLGLTQVPDAGESYAYLQLPMLKKIVVRGVIHIQKRERPGAFEFFWQLDPTLGTSPEYASTWTKIERDAVGVPQEGEPQPYMGCGGWMGIYEVDPITHQLLVESRMIMHEPQEWFAGSNFLRSKLPLSMQENARSFRRKLAD
jgi:hypothetical protein